MRKKGIEFNFAWLFAILVGAIIIFLAIYFAAKLVGTKNYEIDTVTAKQLSIIFEPMETGLATGKSTIAKLNTETRVYDKCYTEGSFGKQRMSLTTKGFGSTWKKAGADIPITNKYIFSNDTEQGKLLYLFSKPFKMPWKVSEIIFMTGNKYCFVNAPEEIRDEVKGLNLANIKLENCTNEIKVCFNQGNCEINVQGTCLNCENEYDSGIVSKGKEKLYYSSFVDYSGEADRSLLYAAIFSSKDVYECNTKRLMSRLIQEALVYKDEASFLTGKCGSLQEIGVIQLVTSARQLENSRDLELIKQSAESLDEENQAVECKLW